MDIVAIAANGVSQADAGFQQAAAKLSSSANPVDTVSLSDAAVALTQDHLSYSLAVKTLKIADDMEKVAIGIIE
jgi:hypothetical protein